MRITVFIRALACASVLLSCCVQAQQSPRYNQISLQAQASADVVHDLMRVTLYYEVQDSDPVKLAAQATRALNAATLAARKIPDVTIQSGARASYPVYGGRDNRRVVAWRERAELQLESRDFPALAALTASLQEEGMHMAHRQFLISKTRRAENEHMLIQQAIAAFRARAQLATDSLGAKAYRLVKLDLDSSGFNVIARRQMAVATLSASSVAQPQEIEAGTSEVRMTAHGVIEVLE